jgi:hypothetical protein
MKNDLTGFIGRLLGFDGFYQRSFTTQQLGVTVPDWVNTSDLWVLYREIPELNTVINRYAKMVASANPIVRDKMGAVVDPNGHWIFGLIDRPNAMQSWGDVMTMTAINKALTNNALIFAPKGTLGNRQNLTPIAWNNVKVQGTGKDLRQTTIDGFIKEFLVPVSNTSTFQSFDPLEMIYFCDPDGISLFNTESKLQALRYPLSNIGAQYAKRNVLLRNLFALGILSIESNDMQGALPLDSAGKKEILDDLKQRHNGEVAVTDKRMRWEPMSFPTKDLMLFEELTADKITLIDHFGLNVNMFGNPTGAGSTFSNVEMGEKQAYNSTIIPDTEIMYDGITKQLGLDKEGLYLTPSFEHISVLQQDKNKDAQALLSRAQALEKIAMQLTLTDDEKKLILHL